MTKNDRHMTDCQSFPMESKKFPKLWEGSWSPQERYTQEAVKKIVEYAKERGIRVVLELDGPGHMFRYRYIPTHLWRHRAGERDIQKFSQITICRVPHVKQCVQWIRVMFQLILRIQWLTLFLMVFCLKSLVVRQEVASSLMTFCEWFYECWLVTIIGILEVMKWSMDVSGISVKFDE